MKLTFLLVIFHLFPQGVGWGGMEGVGWDWGLGLGWEVRVGVGWLISVGTPEQNELEDRIKNGKQDSPFD